MVMMMMMIVYDDDWYVHVGGGRKNSIYARRAYRTRRTVRLSL